MEEIIDLTIENPLARMVLAEHNIDHYLASKYRERELSLATSKALDSIENEKVHNLWTGIFLGRIAEFPSAMVTFYTQRDISDSAFTVDGVQCLRQMGNSYFDPERFIRLYDVNKIHIYFRELRMSLRFVYYVEIRIFMRFSILFLRSSVSHSSFLAARYLNKLNEHVRSGEVHSNTRNVAKWLCRHYLQEAAKTPSVIEWSNLDKLFSAENTLQEHSTILVSLAPHLLR